MSAGTENTRLSQGLKQRHMTMIAFGGVIGAGLFVGSGAVIHETGPAAVLSYLLAGTLMLPAIDSSIGLAAGPAHRGLRGSAAFEAARNGGTGRCRRTR